MNTHNQRKLRHQRIRKKISGTENMPRLSIYRSNKHIYAQIIDDVRGATLVSASDFKVKSDSKATKVDEATQVGKALAEEAIAKKIKKVSFDRGGFKFHGRIKALAQSAREGGLDF